MRAQSHPMRFFAIALGALSFVLAFLFASPASAALSPTQSAHPTWTRLPARAAKSVRASANPASDVPSDEIAHGDGDQAEFAIIRSSASIEPARAERQPGLRTVDACHGACGPRDASWFVEALSAPRTPLLTASPARARAILMVFLN